MKALETNYNGILFRSRLEARWAMFFDLIGVEYVYEPECFVLNDGRKYTPDFYIEKYDLYVEIKPNFDWMKDEYHMGRYCQFDGELIILSGGMPTFSKVNYLMSDSVSQAEVVFVPNSKYEPFFATGADFGADESLFLKDHLKELEIVKSHRFWN